MKHPVSSRLAPRPLVREIALIFGSSALLAMPLAVAAPQGGNVVAGQAAIQQNGALTTITQGSQRAAIDWRSFNVGAAETVNFIQPNANAAILNRVVGNDPSAIFGRITANGQVLLINPNGILFGRTAQVDVGALTATTSNLGNADFMAGRLNFNEAGKAGATVENQGRITVAEGGFAALVGRQVANSGVITARLGKVALAGGDAFVLDLYGDKLVNLIVDPAAMTSLADAQGQPLAARVDHSGQIVANGGRVQLSVATVKQLVDNLINLSGVVRATSFTHAPGAISLLGDANTRVAVTGTLDTSGERGGRIEVTGRDVNLQSGATLAATGGQGSIAVGGDWQGKGLLANADRVNVAQGASLDASGGSEGAGGTVVLWSEKNTQFAGRISAAGGTSRGDAGQVEVSSKGQLGFLGDVDVFARNGQQGSLLLDPLNLTIAATTSGDSQIAADQLRYFLTRGANVNLSATQNVTVDAEVNGLVTGGTGVAGGGLTLTAGNNLTINQNIVLNDGALNLTATSGTLSQANGTVLYTGTGAANLRGGAGVNVGQVLSGGAVDIRSANGAVAVRNALVSGTADATAAPLASLNVEGAGTVTLNGALVQGDATVRSVNGGVSLGTAVIQSNVGNVGVSAGTTITSAANSVGLVAGGTVEATAVGNVDLGVVLSDGWVELRSTGGSVTVHQAVAGFGSASAYGFEVSSGGAVTMAGVNAGAGGIHITGVGNITSQGASATQGGLVSAGSVMVDSSAGQAGTSAAPLRIQAGGGGISVGGSGGVNAATLLSGGNINIGSGEGSVIVSQAIAAQPGAVSASTTARPTGVTINGRTGIDMAGAVAGEFGLSMESSAGAVVLRNSVFSDAFVNVIARDAITVQDGAGISTTRSDVAGAISMLSYNGVVTVGNGGVRAQGVGTRISLAGGAGVTVNGDLQTNGGTIALDSHDGAVRVLASGISNDPALNATLDAGTDAADSAIAVSAAGDVEVGEMIAYNGITLTSTGGNVTLRRGLGGNTSGSFGGNPVLLNTGYVDYARGYLSQYRPNVGRLVINAGGSVELNGLNLDGNANATDTTPGLSVTAARRIVSNNEIAVNKGDIVLAGGTAQATDGVYLGNSVYSRGHDLVSGGVHTKTGYGIRITGRVLGLFDNTLEMAQLPVNTFVVTWYEAGPGTPPPLRQYLTDAAGFVVDSSGLRLRNPDGSFQLVGVLASVASPVTTDMAVYNVTAEKVIVAGNAQAGQAVQGVRGTPSVQTAGRPVVRQQEIAKIEIANNVANYQDPSNVGTLVPASGGTATSREVLIGTTTIAGVANHTPQTAMRLTGPAPTLTSLSQAPIVSAPTDAGVIAATRGIGLKVLDFRESGDLSSAVWSSSITMPGLGGSQFFTRVDSTTGSVSIRDLPSTPPVEGRYTVTVPALATRTFTVAGNVFTEVVQLGTGTATHTFDILAPDNIFGNRAQLVQVSFNGASTAGLSNTAPAGATNVSAWTLTGWNDVGAIGGVRLSSPTLSTAGTSSGVRVTASLHPAPVGNPISQPLQTGTTLAPLFTPLTSDYVLNSTTGLLDGDVGARTFELNGIVADSSAAGAYATRPGTRVFLYDGLIDTANGNRIFDSNTGVAIPGLGGIPGFNNSTVGFAGVGAGFGSLGNGTAGSTGVGSTSGQVVGGSTIPGGQSGSGTAPPVTTTVEDRSTQDVVDVVAAPGVANAAGIGEFAFGVRVAAEADLGRGGAVPGSAVNVFKRRYRVATSSNPSVCAPDAVQQTPAQGAAARDCAAK